jgi:hypothetical protein
MSPSPFVVRVLRLPRSLHLTILDAHKTELCRMRTLNRNSKTVHEDARLFATAPELLVALKTYVDHFGDPLKCARAAIAKAEGTPPGRAEQSSDPTQPKEAK